MDWKKEAPAGGRGTTLDGRLSGHPLVSTLAPQNNKDIYCVGWGYLNDRQREILFYLREHGTTNTADLSAVFNVSRGTMSAHLNALKRRKLVEEQPVPGSVRLRLQWTATEGDEI